MLLNWYYRNLTERNYLGIAPKGWYCTGQGVNPVIKIETTCSKPHRGDSIFSPSVDELKVISPSVDELKVNIKLAM